MPKTKPKAWKQDALDLYEELQSSVKVADVMTELGQPVSQTWVWRVCRDAGTANNRVSYDDAMDDEIERLATKKELSQRAIARRLPPSYTYVGKVLRARGIPAQGYQRHGRRTFVWTNPTADGPDGPDGEVEIEIRGRHSAEKCKAVLDAYVAGGQPATLSGEYDMPVSTIEKLVDRAGVMRSSQEAAINRYVNDGHVSAIYRRHQVRRMYVEKTMSITEISEALDTCNATVLSDLDAMGVVTRDRSDAIRIARWGSMRAYHEFCRDAAYRIRVKGEPKIRICEDYDTNYNTLNRALKYWDELQASRDEAREAFWTHDDKPKSSDTLTRKSLSCAA